MMYDRCVFAVDLLAKEGVFAFHIDEYEFELTFRSFFEWQMNYSKGEEVT